MSIESTKEYKQENNRTIIMKIETEEEYDKFCEEVYKMMDETFEMDSDKAKEYLEKCKAIEDYEDIHYPIPEPDDEPENIDGMTDWRETQN